MDDRLVLQIEIPFISDNHSVSSTEVPTMSSNTTRNKSTAVVEWFAPDNGIGFLTNQSGIDDPSH